MKRITKIPTKNDYKELFWFVIVLWHCWIIWLLLFKAILNCTSCACIFNFLILYILYGLIHLQLVERIAWFELKCVYIFSLNDFFKTDESLWNVSCEYVNQSCNDFYYIILTRMIQAQSYCSCNSLVHFLFITTGYLELWNSYYEWYVHQAKYF